MTQIPPLRIPSRVPNRPDRVPMGTDGAVVGFAIADNGTDAESIVNHLQGFVDVFGRTPQVRNAAVSILRSRQDNDLERHARDLLAWVQTNVRYLPDPDGAEWVVSPLVQLDQISRNGFVYGDCDDHVVLLGSLLQSVGIVARVQAVKIRPTDGWFNHVLLSVKLPGGFIDMDPCAKGMPVQNYPVRLVSRY